MIDPSRIRVLPSQGSAEAVILSTIVRKDHDTTNDAYNREKTAPYTGTLSTNLAIFSNTSRNAPFL